MGEMLSVCRGLSVPASLGGLEPPFMIEFEAIEDGRSGDASLFSGETDGDTCEFGSS